MSHQGIEWLLETGDDGVKKQPDKWVTLQALRVLTL